MSRRESATSTHAIAEAYRAVKHGYADAIIAEGTEATVIPISIAVFGGHNGCVASLHLLCKQGVVGSTPTISTKNGFEVIRTLFFVYPLR